MAEKVHLQWRIQDFPGEALIYYLANFCRTLHENEKNWTERWAPPLDLPLISEIRLFP